jgi:hypothetical protein
MTAMAEEVEAKRRHLESLLQDNLVLRARVRALTRAVECGDHNLRSHGAAAAGGARPTASGSSGEQGAASAHEGHAWHVPAETDACPPTPPAAASSAQQNSGSSSGTHAASDGDGGAGGARAGFTPPEPSGDPEMAEILGQLQRGQLLVEGGVAGLPEGCIRVVGARLKGLYDASMVRRRSAGGQSVVTLPDVRAEVDKGSRLDANPHAFGRTSFIRGVFEGLRGQSATQAPGQPAKACASTAGITVVSCRRRPASSLWTACSW